MLSGRPYLRGGYQRERTPFLVWLLSATAAGFVVHLLATQLGLSGLDRMTVFSEAGLGRGYAWTLLTYPFFENNILVVALSGLALFFVGRELVPHVSERRMVAVAVVAAVTGAAGWLAANWGDGGTLRGASPILWCYFTIFACLFPNREISFLVFFVIPVRLRPKYLAWALAGFEMLALLFTQLSQPLVTGLGFAHGAHLAGMLTGWVYFRYVHEASRLLAGSRPAQRTRSIEPTAEPLALSAEAIEVADTKAEDLRAQVDRILDKINSEGFGALTSAEKRVLDDARDALSRR